MFGAIIKSIMTKESRIIIIGAGPSGLSLAVELKRYGFQSVRVVEKLKTLTTRGRALAVIPKTLAYLEPSGTTEKILEEAEIINSAILCKRGKTREIAIRGIHDKYDHLTTIEQENIEKCLIERLKEYGGDVDRGVELTALNAKDRVAILKKGDELEEYHYDLLIGADGVGSTVRQLMQFDYPGFEEECWWEQMEIKMNFENLANNSVYLCLDSSPVLAAIPAPQNVFRVVTPTEGVEESFKSYGLEYIDGEMESVLWKSTFRVGYRSSEEMFEEGVVLIGDAANVHSPVGGRGMNKGIEDAVLLARSMNNGEDLNVWERARMRIDRRLVKRIQFASFVIKQKGLRGRMIRELIWRSSFLFSLLLKNIAK